VSEISEAEFDEIRRLLGQPSLNASLRRKLTSAVGNYLRSKTVDPMRYVNVRKQLSRLRRAAEAARKATQQFRDELAALVALPEMAEADEAEDEAVGQATFQLALSSGDRLDLEAIGDLVTKADDVRSIADAALKRLPPDRRGPTPDDDRYVLMLKLKQLFEQMAGRKATITVNQYQKDKFGGAFFRMAAIIDAAIARSLGEKPSTNSALGEFLRDLLKPQRRERRKTRGAIAASEG